MRHGPHVKHWTLGVVVALLLLVPSLASSRVGAASTTAALRLEEALIKPTTGRPHLAETMTPQAYLPLLAQEFQDGKGGGDRIAFASNRSGNYELFVATFDSAGVLVEETQLTQTEYTEWFPDWSPDGTQIVFLCIDPGGGWNVCTIHADGSDYRQITTWSRQDCGAHRPAWSPDGTQIAVGVIPKWGGAELLYLMDTDGGNQREIGQGMYPTWSPDGNTLAFVYYDGWIYEIWTTRSDGSDRRQLTHEGHDHAHTAWSPDGRLLAFMLDSASVAVMDAQGGPAQTVVAQRSASLSWSPDSTELVIAPGNGLWVVKVDGSGLRQITSHGIHPSWGPAQ